FLKISDFADDLLAGLETLERWPEKVRLMQKNWIGRSEGARVFFPLEGKIPNSAEQGAPLDSSLARSDAQLEVFTTRPDTLFGASFCALSPHHPLTAELAKDNPA